LPSARAVTYNGAALAVVEFASTLPAATFANASVQSPLAAVVHPVELSTVPSPATEFAKTPVEVGSVSVGVAALAGVAIVYSPEAVELASARLPGVLPGLPSTRADTNDGAALAVVEFESTVPAAAFARVNVQRPLAAVTQPVELSTTPSPATEFVKTPVPVGSVRFGVAALAGTRI